MGQDNNSKKFGRRYLIYAILIASAAALSFLYIDLLDVEETLVKEEFEYHEKRVLDDMDDFFRPINQEFNFMVELMVLEGFDLSDSMAFIPRFIPLLKSSKAISSVMLADEEGNEQMLLKMER
ncbi:MAG: hypothetical protein CMP59_10585 [Flavobacteriales bacterium]|nr:hypothetical protein [Flavobacteriales bacterium]|tara:strand:- start:295 stop:663 length:369 start_codon:yes stop_codon:yes gene_type:complete